MNYILGIDIGTSNTKAIGYTARGEVVAHTNSGYSFSSDREGYHEIDPRLLFDAVINVIAGAVKAAAGKNLIAVSFSAAMHGIIAVDEHCNPLTNMITWADLRSMEYALKLKDTEEGKNIYRRTGTPVHPMSPLCKLMWMKDNLTEVFHSAYKFISIKEYVFFHLFGKFIIDHSIASSTGLFDIYDIGWNTDALRVAGITAGRLSDHVGVTYIVKGLKNDYHTKLNIDSQTPFVIGGSDGCLAHLGSNALKNGDVSLTIGTSGAVRMMMPQPVYDKEERIFNYLLTDDLYVSGGPTNNGGNVVQWFNKNMAGKESNSTEEYNWFMGEAAKIEPGSGGLIFLPYIYGERAPVWDASARGVFFGINGSHTQAHFMRSVIEGVSFALYGILKTLEDSIAPAENIYVSGGFINSTEWVQLLADVLGKKLQVTGARDASAAGAAIIGMKAVGMIKAITEAGSFFSISASYDPDLRKHEVYKGNYAVYSQLYNKLKDIKK
jgi:gluconokinase